MTDIDKLITIYGMVIRTSSLIPEMREAFFKCYVCGNTLSVEIDRGRIAEPTLCTHCNTNHSFALVHNRSHFSDKQMIKLQESPGECWSLLWWGTQFWFFLYGLLNRVTSCSVLIT